MLLCYCIAQAKQEMSENNSSNKKLLTAISLLNTKQCCCHHGYKDILKINYVNCMYRYEELL